MCADLKKNNLASFYTTTFNLFWASPIPIIGKDILLLSSKNSSTAASLILVQCLQYLQIRNATHTSLSFTQDRIWHTTDPHYPMLRPPAHQAPEWLVWNEIVSRCKIHTGFEYLVQKKCKKTSLIFLMLITCWSDMIYWVKWHMFTWIIFLLDVAGLEAFKVWRDSRIGENNPAR